MDLEEPDAAQLDLVEPDAVKLDLVEPDAVKLDLVKPWWYLPLLGQGSWSSHCRSAPIEMTCQQSGKANWWSQDC